MKQRPIVLVAALAAAAVSTTVLVTVSGGAQQPAAAPSAQETRSIDNCCMDLDGEGAADDGVFAIVRGGEILVAFVYEDPDHNKRFDTADQILAITTSPGPGAKP